MSHFEENFERIFGSKPIERGSWVQDPETGQLIAKEERVNAPAAPAIHGPIEPFTSPIDGTLIDDRAKLRVHNAKHGVTNIQDYGDNGGREYFDRKHRERSAETLGLTKQAKAERVETIKRAMAQHGMS